MERAGKLPSEKTGSYSWYGLADLVKIKELIKSDIPERHVIGVRYLTEMGLLLKEYAEKLAEYERLYLDDGK